MSIASEITRINNNIASAYSQCQSKGATMPATQNSDNLANTISTISGGGGGVDINDYFNTTIDRVSTSGNAWGKDLIKKIPRLTIASGITSLEYAFEGSLVGNVKFEGIDCTNITSLYYTFYNNPILTSIDLSNITNTANITDVRYLFYNTNKIEEIKNMFPLSGTVDIRVAFSNLSKLKKLDLSNWNITTSGNSLSAFTGTYLLAVLDISNITFSNTTSSTFSNCGRDCLQSDGAYADGIPYVYVKDSAMQTKVLSNCPSTWSTNNVVIKSN